MPRPKPAAVAITAAAIAISGCGISDPLQDQLAEELAKTPNEAPGPTPPDRARTPVAEPSATPQLAVERFAVLYINWDYRTLAGIQRRLAASAVGEASAMNARAAARTPADYELRGGRVTNRGQIVALTDTRSTQTGASERHLVLVTFEHTTGGRVYDELRPAYHVTLATARRVQGGWAVSRWEPQT